MTTAELVKNADVSTLPSPALGNRIVSLDQFRGYTVAGMLLVNFLGGFAAVPAILKHHNTYCSYADTIMPQFFFAVGFAYRLTFLRRLETLGRGPASAAVLRRNLGLILLGFVLYHLDGEVKSWDELPDAGRAAGSSTTAFQRDAVPDARAHRAGVDLGPAGDRGRAARPGRVPRRRRRCCTSGSRQRFYFDWAWDRPVIDGGPLGFLTWTIPLLVGSLAYDVVAGAKAERGPRLAGRGRSC